jgi:hypothetical protein
LDFSKAFDKIDHLLIITKLKNRKVPLQLTNWIASFLHHRRQRVVIEANYSDWASVTSGVPQGSVLGPLLFNLFVDDLDNVLHPDVKVKKFADDTKLYIKYCPKTASEAHLKLQESLNAVQAWCEKWLMQLNATKCNTVYFGNNNPRFEYKLNGNVLTSASTIRDLGVTVSENACVSNQCLNVAAKARRLTGVMLRTFTSRRRNVIVPMYKSIKYGP